MKHAKANSKYFLDQRFCDNADHDFLKPSKESKVSKIPAKPWSLQPNFSEYPAAQEPCLSPWALHSINSQLPDSDRPLIMKVLCVFHFVLQPAQTHSCSMRAEVREGPFWPLQWGYWDTNSRNNPPWPLLSSQAISAHLL